MNALQTFDYQGNPVRSVMIDGEPWFVAADVCSALDLDKTWNALSRLDEDEKGATLISTPGGPQTMSTVNEPGLYSLIQRSRKPEAKAFKRWVNHEVLPTIRKRGSFTTPGLETPNELYIRELERKVDRLTDLAIQQTQVILSMQTQVMTLLGAQSKPRKIEYLPDAEPLNPSSIYGSAFKIVSSGYADRVIEMYRSGKTQTFITDYLNTRGLSISKMSVLRFVHRYAK